MKLSNRFFPMVLLSITLLGIQPLFSQDGSRKDKPTLQTWERKSNDAWALFRKVKYFYDQKGRMIEERASTISGPEPVPVYRFLYEYDQRERLVKRIRQSWQDESWVFLVQYAYEFDGERIVSRRDSAIRNGTLSLMEVTYEYDQQQLLQAEVSREVSSDLPVMRSKVSYGYNEVGENTIKEFPVWSGSDWSPSRKMTLDYNLDGHHVKTTRYKWEKGQWVFTLQYDLSLDQKGRRTAELWKRPGQDGLDEFMRITYQYK